VLFGDTVVELKKGELLIFPSNFLYPHKVEPVKKGKRYTYISWVW
jgi:predicted 2-oxoglutarate/Fe(II)-dependent dioxygenase YbiX